MNYGFSGTQHGMTDAQLAVFLVVCDGLLIDDFHHGDCVGSDEQAHECVKGVAARVVVHPPDDNSKRAFCAGNNVTVLDAQPYLVRNRDIVDASDCLLATPHGHTEQIRSGTWATIRYARFKLKPCVLIMPDGSQVHC